MRVFVIIKSGQDPVNDLTIDKLLIGLVFFAYLINSFGMLFHILYIMLSIHHLLFSKRDFKTSVNLFHGSK